MTLLLLSLLCALGQSLRVQSLERNWKLSIQYVKVTPEGNTINLMEKEVPLDEFDSEQHAEIEFLEGDDVKVRKLSDKTVVEAIKNNKVTIVDKEPVIVEVGSVITVEESINNDNHIITIEILSGDSSSLSAA